MSSDELQRKHQEWIDNFKPERRSDNLGFWTPIRVSSLNFFLILLTMAALSFNFFAVGNVQDAQDAGRERGFQIRAQTCRIENALKVPLDSSCLEPDVLVYYDPEEVSNNIFYQKQVIALLCAIAERDDLGSLGICEPR